MPSTFHQLLYLSRAAVAFDEAAIANLAERAEAFNARHGITGLLLYDGGRFIQALEGSPAAVDAATHRIMSDRRHDSIDIIHRGPGTQPLFLHWPMEVRHIHDSASARRFLKDIRRKLAGIEDPRLISTFIGFVLLGRPQLRAAREPDDRPIPATDVIVRPERFSRPSAQ